MTQRLLKWVIAAAALTLLATMTASSAVGKITASAKTDNPRFTTEGGVDRPQ